MEENKKYTEERESRSVDTGAEYESEVYAPDEGGSYSESGEKKKKFSKKAVIISALVAVVSVIALVLFLVLGGNTDNGESPDEETGESDGKKENTDTSIFEYDVNSDGKTCTITGLKNKKSEISDITIPGKIGKYSVTKIGKGAFMGNYSLVNVRISKGVTEIGMYAFYDCPLIEKVELPNSLTRICSGAFFGCYSLKDIKLPSSLITLESYVFEECDNLEIITENNLTYLSQDGNPYYALLDIYHGITEYTIKASTVILSCGLDTYGLNKIEVEDGNKYYKVVDGSLYSKDGKRLILYIDKTNTGVFRIPDGVTVIVDSAFSSYLNITGVEIPEGVKEIEHYALSYCENIEYIEIPRSVSKISELALPISSSFKEIIVDPENDNYKSIDGNLYSKDGKTLICYASGKEDTSFEIPSGVTQLADYAISYSSLNEITIPDGVTSIGVYSISNCEELNTVYMPDSVKEIKMFAFAGCENLSNITLSSQLVKIGDYAFDGCYSLTELNISDKVEKIGKIVFPYNSYPFPSLEINVDPENKYYKSMDGTLYTKNGDTLIHYAQREEVTHFEVPEGVITIEDFAFAHSNLESVILPDSLRVIGEYAFHMNFDLSSIELTENLESIGRYAFAYGQLESIIIPDSVSEIGEGAFTCCRNLESIDFPSHVDSFGWHVFSYCPITEIVLPEGVKRLSEGDFYDCSSLEYIYIPASITDIGEDTFEGCEALMEIEVNPNNENYKIVDGNLYTKDGKTLVLYLKSNTSAYFEVPDGVATIGYGAFYGNSSLVTVKLPNTVTTIGEYAFRDCVSLVSVNVTGSLTHIGDGAFRNCSALTDINLPDTLVSIGNFAFKDCGSVNGIYLPDGLTYLGYRAFENCGSLTSISIPSGITEIREGTFSSCENLTDVIMPWGVVSIGDYAFYYCTQLSDFELPSTLVSIGDYAFDYCRGFDEINLPSSLTEIGEYAFALTRVKNITVPHNVSYIGYCAFYGCYLLESIYVDSQNENYKAVDSVIYTKDGTEIVFYPSSYVDGERHFEIPTGVTVIGDYVFQNSLLESIVIPESVKEIGHDAFWSCDNLTEVYYKGSEEEWNEIEIDENGNDNLLKANIFYNHD